MPTITRRANSDRRRRRPPPGPWRSLVAILILAGLCLAAPAAEAAFPGENGKIAYARSITTSGAEWIDPRAWLEDGETYQIVTISSDKPDDASDQRVLTASAGDDRDPAWSPDGRKIVFASNRDALEVDGRGGNFEIYVMDENGLNQTRLTTHAAVERHPAVSPDGKTIAFTSNRDGNFNIYTMSLENPSQAPKRLTDDARDDFEPAFSPDGRIAFDSGGEIVVMNGDGSKKATLTSSGGTSYVPSFSPDGKRIAFTQQGAGAAPAVYTMNADGSGTKDKFTDGFLADFSPDGQKMTFNRMWFGGQSDVFTANAEGASEEAHQTVTLNNEYGPAWGPKPDTAPECFDKQDNDTDGKADYPADPGCESAADAAEVDPEVPAASISDVAVSEGNAGATEASFTITLAPAGDEDVTVDYSTVADTATSAVDYAPASGTVTFAKGELSKTVKVDVHGDRLDEPDERFLVKLSNGQGATISDDRGVGTILNDDPPPTISIDDVAAGEGDSDSTADATFGLSLSAPSEKTVTVTYGTANGTATAPSDYDWSQDTVTFAPGEVAKAVTVKVKGDELDELDEHFAVDLRDPGNATLAKEQGRGTIVDDDGAPTVSIGDATVTEGDSGTRDAIFTVSLSNPSGQEVRIDYATADDSATALSDYRQTSRTLIFPAGETSKAVTVPVNGDSVDEDDERFLVGLSNPKNATVTAGPGIGTIRNDDLPPSVSITDARVTEGDSGERDATFTVSLSSASSRRAKVNVRTADDSASAPADYAEATPRLTFTAGETAKTVAVRVRGDTVDEPDERFLVNLSAPENASIADGQGIGTIGDDDAAGGGAARTPGRTTPPAKDAGCVSFRSGIGAGRLGPARLGMSRKRHRAIFKGARLSSRGGLDRSCIAGGGSLRIGYPTERLLRRLRRSERRRVRNRAALVLTSSRRYSIRRVRPGDSVATLRRRLKGERAYRVAGVTWYLARAGASRPAFRIRSGRVVEIGLADRRLTRTRRSARRLLGAWKL